LHFAISSTWGPTDPTRAMLPFIFAASALQAGDRVTLMLFHDAVLLAVEGMGAKLVPVGPPNRYEEVAGHDGAKIWACKPWRAEFGRARHPPAVTPIRNITLR
jgi:tRNA 2-thiouridine synthesizing protein D